LKTIKQHIRKSTKQQFEELNQMCISSRKLYNCGLYVCRQYYEETGKYIGYNNLYHALSKNEHYKAFPSRFSQQTLRLVDKNYRAFFALLRKKGKGEYAQPISMPKYLKKDSKYILVIPGMQVKLRDGYLILNKSLKLPFSYNIPGEIRQIIIKPRKNNYFLMFIQYEEDKNENIELNQANYLSIDLGLNNFAACFTNIGHSFIMNGAPLKSYNQFYNKQKASIQSELKTCNSKRWSNKLERININRQNWIDNYFNQTVAYITKYCIKHNIGNVIVGYNEKWKQELNMGHINNRQFSDIPFYLFKRKLENKCYSLGINFQLVNEAYTSKCSFVDNESIKKHDEYIGKRIKRGLFRTENGTLINADINGAANILRKVVSKVAITDEIMDSIVSPVKLKHCFNPQII
jgi:IS605 OrfB family transposase